MKLPEMIAANSSMLVSFGYDAITATLYAQFKGGKVYRYLQVPIAHFTQMQQLAAGAGSVGQYFNANVKPNFQFELVQ